LSKHTKQTFNFIQTNSYIVAASTTLATTTAAIATVTMFSSSTFAQLLQGT